MTLFKLSDCSHGLLRRQGDSQSPERAVSFSKLTGVFFLRDISVIWCPSDLPRVRPVFIYCVAKQQKNGGPGFSL